RWRERCENAAFDLPRWTRHYAVPTCMESHVKWQERHRNDICNSKNVSEIKIVPKVRSRMGPSESRFASRPILTVSDHFYSRQGGRRTVKYAGTVTSGRAER